MSREAASSSCASVVSDSVAQYFGVDDGSVRASVSYEGGVVRKKGFKGGLRE